MEFDFVGHLKKCYALEAVDPVPMWKTFSAETFFLMRDIYYEHISEGWELRCMGVPPEMTKNIIQNRYRPL